MINTTYSRIGRQELNSTSPSVNTIVNNFFFSATPGILVRALILSSGYFKQISNAEIGNKKALILSSGIVIEQSPLIGIPLIYSDGYMREKLPTETLIL